MATENEMNEKLFSYGTLRFPAVQLATFGRQLKGTPDIIAGYHVAGIEINELSVVTVSGASTHPILVRTGKPEDKVNGLLFDVTLKELQSADKYEVANYKRVRAKLQSGIEAWVYVSARTES